MKKKIYDPIIYVKAGKSVPFSPWVKYSSQWGKAIHKLLFIKISHLNGYKR